MGCDFICAKKMDELIESGNTVVIDLRAPEMYANGHIRGALNIPLNQMEQHIFAFDSQNSGYSLCAGKECFNRSKMIIFYCERGASSLLICQRMGRLGFNVRTLAGGILRYHGKYFVRND